VISTIASIPVFIFGEISTTSVVIMAETYLLGYVVVASIYAYDLLTDKFRKPYKNRILIKITIILATAFLLSLLLNELELFVGFKDDDFIQLGEITINPYWTNVIDNMGIWLITGLILLISENVIDKQRVNLKEVKEELSSLKTELYSANVKPHFIFNTLNGLITLIHEDPDKAENLVIQLSDFLRNSLYQAEGSSHSLAKEADLITEYLNIEKTRFGDRFNFEFKLDDQSKKIIVPKFFSLSLVENCIKHNGETPHLFIQYEAKVKENSFQLKISDNGKHFPKHINENEGLRSTRAILESKFANAYKISFINEELVKYVLIEIEI